MNDDEMTALRESIAAIGQQVPIIVWRGDVIDGRKRLAACEALGREPIVTTIADDASPQEYATALNILRTHYTTGQRAAFAERIATATKADGRRIADAASGNSHMLPVGQREAARAFAVEPSAVSMARKIRRNAAPEVIGAVEAGRLTLHAAEQITTKVPHERQAQVVEQVIREAKGKRNTPSKIINAAAPGKKRPPRRDITVVRQRSLQTIHACCSALDQFMDEPIAPESDVDGWLEWLRDIRRTVTTITRHLENCPRERSA